MYEKVMLGLEEARKAVDAVIAEASRTSGPPVAVAVVDDHGDLVCFARMDKIVPHPLHMAMNKAYTAARRASDTPIIDKRQREQGYSLPAWGDSRYTTVQGGVCITKPPGQGFPPAPGTVVGGIGVSGRRPEEDEELALVGLRAMGL